MKQEYVCYLKLKVKNKIQRIPLSKIIGINGGRFKDNILRIKEDAYIEVVLSTHFGVRGRYKGLELIYQEEYLI